ncbi:2-oxoisovalerate dehydrogenase subunit alpha 2, mitochondrial-like isoform X2 [Abrus precatorius]|uniref:2-oxoisovalerate dehydrogenase subunit alpha 2, mitochondrial-like isoform X2 n=1 Tax=Abrus precatorius TaxID=3816 RepID=A0A8B8M7E4_ABRPR|nr:2-oxoisovalerate dehydrogenase subunit alpha 2, mitochondrial-like isoform X2 [Abrus precatorius]
MASFLLGRSRIFTLHKNLSFLSAPLLNHTPSPSSFFPSTYNPFLCREISHAPTGNNSATLSSFSRFESTKAAAQLGLDQDVCEDDHNQVIDFPGGKVAFTSEMRFISESPQKRVPCYRVLDENGELVTYSNYVQVSKEMAVKMYSDMVTLQSMDSIFYEVQRQGRISFYLTSMGEEAVNIASAAALAPDDIVLPQKFRTQLPQAVGAAYSLKMDGKSACAVTYCGDGGSSEGDFHAGMNFAAVMEAPVVFICRNNGWAISTPIEEQFRSDGIVVKGQAYGIWSVRVDGNDALAVYSAVHTAREVAIREKRPVLIEALTYRVGHHSTSDDSTKYRPIDEIEYWKMARNPVNRFKRWVERNGWWSDKDELELRSSIRKQLMHAIQVAEKAQKPPLEDMFNDVYDQVPSNLKEQERVLRETIEKHPKDYPSDVPL